MLETIGIILICIAAWLWTWGVLMADINGIASDDTANEEYRGDLAGTCLFAMIPLFWIASLFVTGFWEKGWRLSRRKSDDRGPA